MPTKTITCSGIDGAGKSTQIAALERWLEAAGYRIECVTFWDDVVMFPRVRELLSRKAFGGDQGVGSPQKPLHRRDKNVTTWPMMIIRLFLYFVDALSACRTVERAKRREVDVLIFDRYIYDELANLPLHRWAFRTFCRIALRIAPRPDVALLFDADPDAAHARKPEYPLEFLYRNRNAYLELSRIVREMVVLEPQDIDAVEENVKKIAVGRLALPEPDLRMLSHAQ